MESYRIHKVPAAACTPTQATTIPLQPKGLRGKKCHILLETLIHEMVYW